MLPLLAFPKWIEQGFNVSVTIEILFIFFSRLSVQTVASKDYDRTITLMIFKANQSAEQTNKKWNKCNLDLNQTQ